jgi:hypothetical protein
MSRRLRVVPQVLAAVVVVGGIAFGAKTAAARKLDECQPCFNDFECEDCCLREYGLPGECFEAFQACLCG